mmetsp:Transcript_78239/g.221255  ORF Transcript_78239/g.221255 Transcript_78239/m.221255 type:complete len:582 (+) Transcript_78239:473-2218(+)
MEGRQPQAALKLHKPRAAVRTGRAREGHDLGRCAARASDAVTLGELRDLPHAPVCHRRVRRAVHAARVGVVVGRHAHWSRRSRPSSSVGRGRVAGVAPGRGLWRGHLAEDVIGLLAEPLEERATVALHARVLEVVADLELVCEHDRWQVVAAPLHEVRVLGERHRGLPKHVLEKLLHALAARRGRGLDGRAGHRHQPLRVGHVRGRLRDGRAHALLEGLHEAAAAPLLLHGQGRLLAVGRGGDLARGELHRDLLPVDVLELEACAQLRSGLCARERHGHNDVLALAVLQVPQADPEVLALVLNGPARVNKRLCNLRSGFRLVQGHVDVLAHRREEVARHVHEGRAHEARIGDEGVRAGACISQAHEQLAVEVVAEAEGVDGAGQALVLVLVGEQVRDDGLAHRRLAVCQQHDMAKMPRLLRRRRQQLEAGGEAIPDVGATPRNEVVEGLAGLLLALFGHVRHWQEDTRIVVERHDAQPVLACQRVDNGPHAVLRDVQKREPVALGGAARAHDGGLHPHRPRVVDDADDVRGLALALGRRLDGDAHLHGEVLARDARRDPERNLYWFRRRRRCRGPRARRAQ